MKICDKKPVLFEPLVVNKAKLLRIYIIAILEF